MSSDTPAVVATLVLAVVLIGASAPFTVLWWGEGTKEYEVSWEKAQDGETVTRVTQAGNTAQSDVEVDDKFVAELRLSQDSCIDNRGQPQAPAATIEYTVRVQYQNETTREWEGTWVCGGQPVVIPIHPDHPDVGAREVEDSAGSTEREAARAAVWDADFIGSLNETSTYTLEVRTARAGGNLPVPIPNVQDPSLEVNLKLEVFRWEALVQESTDDEVVR